MRMLCKSFYLFLTLLFCMFKIMFQIYVFLAELNIFCDERYLWFYSKPLYKFSKNN